MNHFFAALLCLTGLQAQNQQSDTLATLSLPEVVVIATRSSLPIADSPSPVEVLRNDKVVSFDATSADRLFSRANGVVLQDLGGDGALKTASIRGTATQHVLILINGVRLSSFQNGLVDLSILPLADIDRIEILRGGSSALYGADAIGGVVNILTRTAGSGARARAEAHAGSFGFRRWMAEGNGRLGSVGLLAGFAIEEGRGDYTFSISRPNAPDTSLKRDNSDFRRKQLYVHGDAILGPQSVLTFMGQAARAESGVPGSLSFPSPQARQHDDIANLQINYHTQGIEGIDLDLRSGFRYGLQTYLDPNPLFPLDTYYRTSSVTFNPQIHTGAAEGLRMTLGAELNEARLSGADFSGRVRRTQEAVYLSGEFHAGAERSWPDRVSVYGSVRYDDFSDVANALTPKVGMNVRLLKKGDVRLRASYGRSFRAPSFNDLYYAGFNNPLLKPERSTNADVGVTTSWDDWAHHAIEITWYSLRIKNRIVFDLTSFRPENIGLSSSEGIEARYSGVLPGGMLEYTINYTFTDTRKLNRESAADPTYDKHLPFIPSHLFNASLTVSLDPLSLSVFHLISGRRFANNDNSRSIPPYRFTNVSVSVPLVLEEVHFRLGVSVENVFDLQFSIMPEYPMPGRRVKAGIRFEY